MLERVACYGYCFACVVVGWELRYYEPQVPWNSVVDPCTSALHNLGNQAQLFPWQGPKVSAHHDVSLVVRFGFASDGALQGQFLSCARCAETAFLVNRSSKIANADWKSAEVTMIEFTFYSIQVNSHWLRNLQILAGLAKTVTGYGLDGGGVGVWVQVGPRFLSSPRRPDRF
jgi:hypothetical protein